MDRDALRILDANLNRAREALRVMEDFARFCLDDAVLTSALKDLRHELSAAALGFEKEVAAQLQAGGEGITGDAQLPSLIEFRDITGDVGRETTTTSPLTRGDVGDVVLAGAKRLGEALRSIEEYGKTLSSDFAQTVEKLRYRGYELERRIMQIHRARERFAAVRLYVIITEGLCRGDWFETARAVVEGGADCLQLREKNLTDRELLERTKRLTALCREHGKLLIVNNRPDIAAAGGAHGVHLGQDDLPTAAARRILTSGMLIGVSTHTLQQVEEALAFAPDYIAVGPMFASSTKPQPLVPGPASLSEARARTAIPLVAIGGITEINVGEVLSAGQCAVCVCSAVVSSADPDRAVRQLLSRFPPSAAR